MPDICEAEATLKFEGREGAFEPGAQLRFDAFK
jgi:hypothetical protein